MNVVYDAARYFASGSYGYDGSYACHLLKIKRMKTRGFDHVCVNVSSSESFYQVNVNLCLVHAV